MKVKSRIFFSILLSSVVGLGGESGHAMMPGSGGFPGGLQPPPVGSPRRAPIPMDQMPHIYGVAPDGSLMAPPSYLCTQEGVSLVGDILNCFRTGAPLPSGVRVLSAQPVTVGSVSSSFLQGIPAQSCVFQPIPQAPVQQGYPGVSSAYPMPYDSAAVYGGTAGVYAPVPMQQGYPCGAPAYDPTGMYPAPVVPSPVLPNEDELHRLKDHRLCPSVLLLLMRTGSSFTPDQQTLLARKASPAALRSLRDGMRGQLPAQFQPMCRAILEARAKLALRFTPGDIQRFVDQDPDTFENPIYPYTSDRIAEPSRTPLDELRQKFPGSAAPRDQQEFAADIIDVYGELLAGPEPDPDVVAFAAQKASPEVMGYIVGMYDLYFPPQGNPWVSIYMNVLTEKARQEGYKNVECYIEHLRNNPTQSQVAGPADA